MRILRPPPVYKFDDGNFISGAEDIIDHALGFETFERLREKITKACEHYTQASLVKTFAMFADGSWRLFGPTEDGRWRWESGFFDDDEEQPANVFITPELFEKAYRREIEFTSRDVEVATRMLKGLERWRVALDRLEAAAHAALARARTLEDEGELP